MRTQLVEHVHDVFPIHNAIAVPVQYLECFPHCPDLGGLQLRQRAPLPYCTRDRWSRGAALRGCLHLWFIIYK